MEDDDPEVFRLYQAVDPGPLLAIVGEASRLSALAETLDRFAPTHHVRGTIWLVVGDYDLVVRVPDEPGDPHPAAWVWRCDEVRWLDAVDDGWRLWLASHAVWEPTWSVRATFAGLTARAPAWTVEPLVFDHRQEASEVVSALMSKQQFFASDQVSSISEEPPPFLDLMSLQRQAKQQWGLSFRVVNDAAVRLYEVQKIISYPRTSSRHLPSDYVPFVLDILQRVASWSGEYAELGALAARVLETGPRNLETLLDSRFVEDHFAIVPTGAPPIDPTTAERRVFESIIRGFLAALMKPARWTQVVRRVEVVHTAMVFRQVFRQLAEPGFYTVWGEPSTELPAPLSAPWVRLVECTCTT